MKIAIVTPTYRKLDGSTYNHLKKTLESVKNQIHQDYKLFLIGDDYTDNEELLELSKILPQDKIYVENLPVAIERIKYSGRELWTCGGTNATRIGVNKALEEGFSYMCHLDHDDIFLERHLKVISDCIESTGTNFIATKCGEYPPLSPYIQYGYYNRYRPMAERLFKVSACMNERYYNIPIVNVLETTGRNWPGDADFWDKISAIMINKQEWGIFINEVTCIKNGEGETYKFPHNVK